MSRFFGAGRWFAASGRSWVRALVLLLGLVLVSSCDEGGVADSEEPAAARSIAGYELSGDGRVANTENGFWRRLRRLDNGDVVSLRRRPERIVSQSLASDEILLELCADRLVAVSGLALDPRYSLAIAAAEAIEHHVLSSAEQILVLRPDVVFVAGYTTPETVRQLVQAHAPVVKLDGGYDSLRAIRDNVRLLAFATGTEDAADVMLAELDSRLAAAARTTSLALEQRLVRLAAWDEGVVPARGTIFDDVASRLGAVNVPAAEGLAGWPRIGVETLVSWPLDLLVVPADPGTELEVRERLLRSTVLGASPAVRSGAIVVLPRAVFGTVSQHVAELAEQLAQALIETRHE